MEFVLLAQIASTLYMTGIIWYAQIVHYPLFEKVGADAFASYERSNLWRTALVVIPPMLVEGATAVSMIWWRPPGVLSIQLWGGVALLAVIWSTTLLVQAPLHGKLAKGFDPAIHRVVVKTNWIRTVSWSLRGALVLWMAQGAMS
jgi:hypothetical protein